MFIWTWKVEKWKGKTNEEKYVLLIKLNWNGNCWIDVIYTNAEMLELK